MEQNTLTLLPFHGASHFIAGDVDAGLYHEPFTACGVTTFTEASEVRYRSGVLFYDPRMELTANLFQDRLLPFSQIDEVSIWLASVVNPSLLQRVHEMHTLLGWRWLHEKSGHLGFLYG
jgi:hypothetical protein